MMKFKSIIDNTEFEITDSTVYKINTNIEKLEEFFIDYFNINSNKVLIVNSFSKKYKTVQIPQYIKNNKKVFKKKGIKYNLGFFKEEIIKTIIENEVDYYYLFINMAGFSIEALENLRLYYQKNIMVNKIIFIVNYDLNNNFKIEIINSQERTIVKI